MTSIVSGRRAGLGEDGVVLRADMAPANRPAWDTVNNHRRKRAEVIG
jgi:hypothetical protein